MIPIRRTLVTAAALVASTLTSLTLSATASTASTTAPACVVSLSPTATETLFAIGAGRQVVAVDKDANYPTTGLPKLRIDAFSPSAEAIAGLCPKTKAHPSTKPDLVVISYDANSVKENLTTLGVKVVEQDAASSLSDALGQIRALGQLTGHAPQANKVATALASHIAADVASVPAHPGRVLSTYYELDPTLYSLTSDTFVGSLLKSLGVVNVADAVAAPGDYGYPQLTSEYLIAANPRLVFLADTKCCSITAFQFSHRTGFSSLRASTFHHIVGLDDDVASRWGPRLGLLMDQLTKGVKATLADTKSWR